MLLETLSGDLAAPLEEEHTRLKLFVGPVPQQVLESRSAGGWGSEDTVPSTVVADWLRNYQTLRDVGAIVGPTCSLIQRGNLEARVSWELGRTLGREERHELHRSITEGRADDISRTLRPDLPGAEQPCHPLIAWWAILYALSMLARYFPREWTSLLDIDRSTAAVPLEALVAAAHSEIPDLLMSVLTGPTEG